MSQEVAKTSSTYARELKKLRGEHHVILRLHAAGMSNKEIADRLDCSEVKVSYTLNCDLGRQKLKHLQQMQDDEFVDGVMDEIQSLAPIAVAELEEALVHDKVDKKERIKVAQDLLDRAGYGKTKNVNLREEKVDDDDLREIKERAKQKEGVVEEATVLEETD